MAPAVTQQWPALTVLRVTITVYWYLDNLDGVLDDMMTKNRDGVALFSAAHPHTPWWRMPWRFWFRRDVRASAVEEIEIDLPDSKDVKR